MGTALYGLRALLLDLLFEVLFLLHVLDFRHCLLSLVERELNLLLAHTLRSFFLGNLLLLTFITFGFQK